MLESPLKNNINKYRILKLKLPIKKTKPSPSESAKFFKVGTKKKGNDGNIWIIKENVNKIKKWCKKIYLLFFDLTNPIVVSKFN